MEPYTRINDVIISGLNIKTRSYARALTAGEADEQDASSTEQQVATFLQSEGIQLDRDNIEAYHAAQGQTGCYPEVCQPKTQDHAA